MKKDAIASIIYILIIVPLLSSITIFENECYPFFYKIITSFSKFEYICGCEPAALVYAFVMPIVSAIFSSILNEKKYRVLAPIFMPFSVFLFIIIARILYDIRFNHPLEDEICYIILYFLVSIPTFFASLFGIFIRIIFCFIKSNLNFNKKKQ